MAVEERPIQGKIHMITGGSSGSTVMKRPRLEDRLEDTIIFTEQDAEGVQQPHNDVVVVTLNIADYNIHRVFVDNGSSVDILYFFDFSQMELTPDQLSRFDTPIQGFSGSLIIPKGMIKLPVTVGTPPQQVTIQVDFSVVKLPSGYNAILGQPSLWTLRAVVSSYHLTVKFSIINRVG